VLDGEDIRALDSALDCDFRDFPRAAPLFFFADRPTAPPEGGIAGGE
jgi:hypothetical protein